jgi:hypothetical protein
MRETSTMFVKASSLPRRKLQLVVDELPLINLPAP